MVLGYMIDSKRHKSSLTNEDLKYQGAMNMRVHDWGTGDGMGIAGIFKDYIRPLELPAPLIKVLHHIYNHE